MQFLFLLQQHLCNATRMNHFAPRCTHQWFHAVLKQELLRNQIPEGFALGATIAVTCLDTSYTAILRHKTCFLRHPSPFQIGQTDNNP